MKITWFDRLLLKLALKKHLGQTVQPFAGEDCARHAARNAMAYLDEINQAGRKPYHDHALERYYNHLFSRLRKLKIACDKAETIAAGNGKTSTNAMRTGASNEPS